MERIDIFDYIEHAATVLDEHAGGFAHAAEKLTEFLETTFGGIDATVGITSRIKNRDSLKEKIVRNHLYKDYDADSVVFEMHDIIGVRLECRFFKDEDYLYKQILKVFCVDCGDGLFCPDGKKAIKLKLDTPQPEKQRNGFNIYRIDGIVIYANERYKFELQIKSLVNSFWSEIEHKLIYKNIMLTQTDNLLKDMLNSIYESLAGVDHQLNLIFDKFGGNMIDGQQEQLIKLISAGFNEVYTAIVKKKAGVSVAITDYVEAVVWYLLRASSYARSAKGLSLRNAVKANIFGDDSVSEDDDTNYSSLMVSLMEWMRHVDYESIAIGEKIELGELTEFDGIESAVADIFLKNINSDFYLNTFFHIFFSLERGTDHEDFVDYIKYYTRQITENKTQDRIYRALAVLSELPAHKLPLEETMKRFAEDERY